MIIHHKNNIFLETETQFEFNLSNETDKTEFEKKKKQAKTFSIINQV